MTFTPVLGKNVFRFSNGRLVPDVVRAFSEQFNFTAREREVFAFLVAGRAQKEIATELGIADSTVRFHAIGLYAKCGVRNQREVLALFARMLQSDD